MPIFAADVMDGMTALIIALTGLIGAICTFLTLYLRLRAETRSNKVQGDKNKVQGEENKERMDTMFHNLFVRGKIAAANKEGIHPRSTAAEDCDYSIPDNIRNAYKDLIPALQLLWRTEGRGMGDERFAELILNRLGDKILQHVCEPLGMHQFECLPIAVSLAKEILTITPTPLPT